MFDFSFGEMLVVAVVALIVLGPERLPKAARFAGLWVRKARAQWYSVKSELEQELASDELKRSLQDSRRALDEAEAEFRDIASEAARVRDADETAAESTKETTIEQALVDAAPVPVTADPQIEPESGPESGPEFAPEAEAADMTAPPAPSTRDVRGGQDG
jgi:sec-independent protein translocase protein TatB